MLDAKLIGIQQNCRDARVSWIGKHWKVVLPVILVALYIFHSMMDYISIPIIISKFLN